MKEDREIEDYGMEDKKKKSEKKRMKKIEIGKDVRR